MTRVSSRTVNQVRLATHVKAADKTAVHATGATLRTHEVLETPIAPVDKDQKLSVTRSILPASTLLTDAVDGAE